MSERPSPTARTALREGRWQDGSPDSRVQSDDGLQSRLMWSSVLPAAIVTLIGVAVVAFLLLSTNPPVGVLWAVLIVAALGSGLMIVVAARRARSAVESLDDMDASLRSAITMGQQEIHRLVDQLRNGSRTGQHSEPAHVQQARFGPLAADLERLRLAVTDTAERVANAERNGGEGDDAAVDQRVGVFVNLARRLQSLVHREIQLLDDLEAQVEDPDLLKGLFSVDHLATRIRRHAENLAVLGGAVPRRQWSRPVNMYVVLRSAVAEVEQYSRVKLVRPMEGTLQGHVVADVIHLVAELVENATNFSNPSTQVYLRAQEVTAGLAIEVEDRGLGMPRDDQNRVNAMLSSPDQINIGELLSDGRIGLFVVSTLARRHGIAVQLQTNIYGGIQAAIVVPHSLLGDGAAQQGKPAPVEQPAPAQPRTVEQPRHTPPLEQRTRRSASPEPASPAATPSHQQVSAPSAEPAQPTMSPPAASAAATSSYSQVSEPPTGYLFSNPASTDTTAVHAAIPDVPSQAPVTAPPVQAPVTAPPAYSPTEYSSAPADYSPPTDITLTGAPAAGEPARSAEPVAGNGNGNARSFSTEPVSPSASTRGDQPPRLFDTGDRYTTAQSSPSNSGTSAPPQPARKPLPYAGRGQSSGATDSWSTADRPTPGHLKPAVRSFVPESVPPPPVPEFLSSAGDLSDPSSTGESLRPREAEASGDLRPVLPQRRRQTHLAPELREAPVPQSTPVTAEHDPGLMLAFQQGINRADTVEEQNGGDHRAS
jgi:signal transduction histidine kinase